MSHVINKKTILLLAGIIVLIITSVAIWISITQKDKYAISEEKITQEDRVSVDFSGYSELFTPAQESKIQRTLLTMTTKEVPDNVRFTGSIRESSFKQISEGETSVIIDSPDLQTSYRVSRFLSPEDSLDIVNIVCVDENEKIYKQDYCLVE